MDLMNISYHEDANIIGQSPLDGMRKPRSQPCLEPLMSYSLSIHLVRKSISSR